MSELDRPEDGEIPHRSRNPTERAREQRAEHRARWVDQQIRVAIERGDFDDLPGAGKPIDDLALHDDPDWWLRRLIERERITGVLPPALALRTESARLNEILDSETTASRVREIVEDFNRRVVDARRQLTGGPPVVTAPRDVEEEVLAWRERRAERRSERTDSPGATETGRRRRWWRARRRSPARSSPTQ